ncbi:MULTISPECIES: hypothetical protein [unclassified Anabaena]|uniref:hypothetical protein n=1 Tax=unclassified Anabaena TaxID=2619674 RepID=UPI0006AC7B1B|nr:MULTISPECIES: hypothetical protein [unclassified Anabaena]ALB39897.1 hypothetical protein AA650_04945 [Anabaena sp. WA102]OBQ17638.1 MAG: hypothetical protein AN486_14555 [Anabaena sp. AL93]
MSVPPSKIIKTYTTGETVEEELAPDEKFEKTVEAIEEVTTTSKTGVVEVTLKLESAPVKKH